ncbi:MAG: autotransporter outer membrane beta-barrel domain-containing protein, partial [Arenimonas sp.]
LTDSWAALCAGAASGSDLSQRCAEIFTGGPGSRSNAAVGNFLDEIPGQGRSSTRDGAAALGTVRESIAANVSIFASVDVGRLDRDDSPNEAAFSGDTWSATAGIDWAPTPAWLLGAALNHSQETLDYDNSGGSSRGRYTGLIGYISWNVAPNLSLDGYAGRLDGSNELRRAIDFTLLSGTTVSALATASPDSTRSLSGLGLSWSLPHGAWQWQLGVGADWMKTRLERYSESGGEGLALRVPTREIVTRRGRVDLGLSHTVSTNWGVWQPQLRLGWRHEFANASRALSVSFAGDANATPITFATEDPDNGWGEVALSSVFTFTHGHSAFVEYRQRFGHEFLQERVLALGWRVELGTK